MKRRRSKTQSARRSATGIRQSPWRTLENRYPPLEILSAEQVERIHDASLEVLERYGVEFRNEDALDTLACAGAEVDRAASLVRFDRALVESAIADAPAVFELHARNPARNVTIGGRSLCFDSVGGPPNASDLDQGRTMGTYESFARFVRLAQSLEVLHMIGGSPIAPTDLDAETRHLDCAYAFLTLTDKVWHTTAIGAERVTDALELLRIALGLDAEQLCSTPVTYSVINVNSPRRFDGAMAEGLMALAAHGQAVCITPFTLSGAMSPVTLAGALVQQNAEILAGLVLTQAVRPGAPVLYGGFTSNVDMRSGAPAFGTPEYSKACLAGGQMARRYELPYRSSNTTGSNAVDAQAAYESAMSLWGSVLAHCNVLHHAAGWLEGGLTASFEKAIIDAEMLQMMASFLEPLEVDDESLAVSTIGGVAPGGHFFSETHTLARYEHAFYTPMVSDWRNFETWSEDGAQDATQRANGIWKALLESYEPPPIEPDCKEEMAAFVARRKSEIAAAGDR